jgi:hypothetical protein
MRNTRLNYLLILLVSLCTAYTAQASHILGGGMTYTYLGDSLSYKKYDVTLVIYEDAVNGQPQAIAEDNPAFLAVYTAAAPYNLVRADSVGYASSVIIASTATSVCASGSLSFLVLKKIFIMHYALPANASGYTVSYQRCCNSGAIVNISAPSDNGMTYSCTIPAAPLSNNSASFTNEPPFIVLLNTPLSYDFSATDADGDVLTYGFAPALIGATSTNIKPWPSPGPPFDSLVYTPGFNSQHPVASSPQLQIDASTGIITGKPNHLGRYLVNIYCNEWRGGTLINTITKQFAMIVTDCVTGVEHISEMIPEFYPNPTTSSLTITARENITSVVITNMIGQTLFRQNYHSPQATIDVAHLPAGVYFARINGTYVKRFVKE